MIQGGGRGGHRNAHIGSHRGGGGPEGVIYEQPLRGCEEKVKNSSSNMGWLAALVMVGVVAIVLPAVVLEVVVAPVLPAACGGSSSVAGSGSPQHFLYDFFF